MNKNIDKLIDIAERVKFIFGNTENYPEHTIGYRLATDAKEVLKEIEFDKTQPNKEDNDIEQLADDMFYDQFKSDLVHGYKEPIIQIMKDYATKANTVNKELLEALKGFIKLEKYLGNEGNSLMGKHISSSELLISKYEQLNQL